mmetsp:Transcript_133416/g.371970  ORF Transcript_133416/g.371970 Transcript_133416/m.371970 type:complete len:252 (+) Transcript_133416:53-808(+)
MVHISAASKAAESVLAFVVHGWPGSKLRKASGSPVAACAVELPIMPPVRSETQPTATQDLMSPLQEVANAVSMLPIAVQALWAILAPGLTTGSLLVAVAVLVHNPFSVLYHATCAMYYKQIHPIENNLFLKLDLSFIHIAGMILSLATSGSAMYFAASVALNSICIYRTVTWSNSRFERRLCRVFCILGYMVPVATVDVFLFLLISGVFVVLAACFAFSGLLGGWGHTASHLLLVPFTECLLTAAGKVTFA